MSRIEKLEAKRTNAIDATRALAAFLDSHDLGALSPRFTEVVVALDSGKIEKAIRLDRANKAISRKGIVSLDDLWVTANPGEEEGTVQAKFKFLKRSQHKAISNLRVFLTYDLDHPGVDLEFNSCDH